MMSNFIRLDKLLKSNQGDIFFFLFEFLDLVVYSKKATIYFHLQKLYGWARWAFNNLKQNTRAASRHIIQK